MIASTLPWYDDVAIAITLAGVMFSAFVNLKASRVTMGRVRRLFLVSGVLALFYIPAYASALLPRKYLEPADWSSFMLGFSWIVWWGAPWSAFALFALRRDKELRETLDEANEVVSRLGNPDDNP